MDFTKNKKGLGDLYQDDLQKKLLALNSDAFLENEMSGPDAALKREIEDVSKELFMKLDQLSNFHFVPRAPRTESTIQTQNVASLSLEEAVPIAIGAGMTKSARENFSVKNMRSMRDKAELTKEEAQLEHRQRKRKIKLSKKAKTTELKEKRRREGIALAERFAVKETQRKMERQAKKGKGAKDGEEKEGRRTNTSSKVFKNLDKIVKEDYAKKEAKRASKAEGKGYLAGSAIGKEATQSSTKRYKM
jgi:U3 small nucleolar RNA-associated protein MPP10